jgi:hypothetical protein
MAEIGSFPSRAHAEMAAGMLEAHGIGARVLGDDGGGTAPHVAMGAHGFRLAVADADADDATSLLDAPGDGDGASGARLSPLLRKSAMRWVALGLFVLVVGMLLVEGLR